MKTTLVSIAVAFALGALGGCDRNPNPSQSKTAPAPASTGSSSATTTTPTTPANAGTPSTAEKKEGANPVHFGVRRLDAALAFISPYRY